MINKYIAVVENDYDMFGVLEFLPFQTKHTPSEILQEQKNYRREAPILDTGIVLQSELNPILEILTIQEWFTKYATGVKETRDDVDKKINLQYKGDK